MRGATAPVPPSQRRARIPHGLVTALRVGASAGLLALLIIISRDELSALDVGSKSAAAAWLTGAALVIAAAFVMAAVRWWQVADTLDVRVSGRSTLSIYLAALFVGNFLPTTIGGDVLRVNRLARICGSQANAFATVIIERLTGWVVLPLLTLAALISQPSLLSHSGGQIAGGLALGTLVVLALIVWVAEHPRGLGRLAGGTRIREALGAVHTGLSVFRRHPGAAGRLLTVGLAYQFLLVVATALAGAAIGVNPGLRAWLAFAPMVLIVMWPSR